MACGSPPDSHGGDRLQQRRDLRGRAGGPAARGALRPWRGGQRPRGARRAGSSATRPRPAGRCGLLSPDAPVAASAAAGTTARQQRTAMTIGLRTGGGPPCFGFRSAVLAAPALVGGEQKEPDGGASRECPTRPDRLGSNRCSKCDGGHTFVTVATRRLGPRPLGPCCGPSNAGR